MPDSRDSLVNSLVGPGSAIDGDIDVEGMLRVDGDVRGSIRVTGKIVVGSGGRVEASIRARSAIVGGLVKGDVYVSEQLRLLSGGVIVGNVYAPRIEVEDDTLVNGFIEVNGEPERAEPGLESFVARIGGPEAAERFLGGFRSGDFASGRPDNPAEPRPREAELPAGSPGPGPGESVS
jgi:cytoskeletal protein CcmA (bactofilin family)